MYDEIVVAGAQALHDLSRYRNVETSFGKCPCDDKCPNLRLIVYRLADADEEEGYVVSFGVGPDVWTAALDAHVKLAKALHDSETRDAEVSYLEEMWNATED